MQTHANEDRSPTWPLATLVVSFKKCPDRPKTGAAQILKKHCKRIHLAVEMESYGGISGSRTTSILFDACMVFVKRLGENYYPYFFCFLLLLLLIWKMLAGEELYVDCCFL